MILLLSGDNLNHLVVLQSKTQQMSKRQMLPKNNDNFVSPLAGLRTGIDVFLTH